MGKSKRAKKKSVAGGECAGDGSASKFSVFEFEYGDFDTKTRETLAKFRERKPIRKHERRRPPVDKYDFLERFAQGNMITKTDSGNNISDDDVIDTVLDDRTFGKDVMIPPGSLNYEPGDSSFLKHLGFECSSCGRESCAKRKPEGCTTGKNHINVLHVDSDEDLRMEFRSTSFDLEEKEGSLEGKSLDHSDENNDCEQVVVVAPIYAKYRNRYYTRCLLTFSQNRIRLEGSSLYESNKKYCLEWSTFDILKIEYQQSESVRADFVDLHLRSKDENVAETGNAKSGNMELEFVVLDDPQWFKKQEAIKSLDLKYKAAWKTIMSECSFSKSFEDITYPDGDPDAVFISRRDIELLQPRTFINDTIIDFYIKYLLNKTKPQEQHRFHFFNSFFFRKLVDMGRDLSTACERRDDFRHVCKWTRNVDLFEKDYLFIPVNFSLHWSLIVICHPGEVANVRDIGMDGSSKMPCILHMNSISGSHRGFENLIRSYLWEEWKERQNEQEEDTSKKFLHLNFIELQLPQQENFFDCGLFLLHYAELFLEQASTFSTTRLIDLLNENWFHPFEVSLKKRDHIRQLIHRIVEDKAMADPSAAFSDENHQIVINEGDSSVECVKEKGAKRSCLDIQSKSSDDYYEIKGQHYFVDIMEQKNIDNSASNESCQPQVQEGLEDDTAISFKSSLGNSSKTPVIIDVQDEERCIPSERDKEASSMSSEDLDKCVVEDSEEEYVTETSRNVRPSSFLFSPTRLNYVRKL